MGSKHFPLVRSYQAMRGGAYRLPSNDVYEYRETCRLNFEKIIVSLQIVLSCLPHHNLATRW
jgi:hypothetical protein